MSQSLLLGYVIGYPELLMVGVVVLLLFGHRLPSVMRSLGRGVIEFKKGVHGEDEDAPAEGESKATPSETGAQKG